MISLFYRKIYIWALFSFYDMVQQIILRNLQRPKKGNVYEDIEWLGNSLGFVNGRDTEKMANQILLSVLDEFAKVESVSSEQIARELNVALQRVNYHIRSLIDSGFLYRDRKLIFLRQGSVKSAVEEMRRDANRTFDNLSMIAEEIDQTLGLKNRP